MIHFHVLVFLGQNLLRSGKVKREFFLVPTYLKHKVFQYDSGKSFPQSILNGTFAKSLTACKQTILSP